MNNNWPQLIGLVLIVGFSVISWLYRKLNEQAAKKRAKDMIEERQREMLRTGRDPGDLSVNIPANVPMPDTTQTQRQREISARREAQLTELRRRAQMRQQDTATRAPSSPPTASPPPIRSIPGSSGPTVPQRRTAFQQPRTGPQGQMSQRPISQERARPQSQSEPRPQRQSRPVKAKTRPVLPPATIEEEETTHRLVPEEVTSIRRVSPVVSAAAPQTPEEWRRAIIANEILSPPIAMRSQDVSVPF